MRRISGRTRVRPSYWRAAATQASLALAGAFAGVLAWQLGARIEWVAGSALLFFVMPFTLVAIMRTDKRLLDPALDRNSREAHDLLLKWRRLHAVRSVVGGTSSLIFVFVKH
jgi:Domain of unknown function (DUF1772)